MAAAGCASKTTRFLIQNNTQHVNPYIMRDLISTVLPQCHIGLLRAPPLVRPAGDQLLIPQRLLLLLPLLFCGCCCSLTTPAANCLQPASGFCLAADSHSHIKSLEHSILLVARNHGLPQLLLPLPAV
jgi:hypothetical protein